MRKGIDYSWARPRPTAIRAAGYTFVCRYLSWDHTGKNLSQAEARALGAAGVDVVCSWEFAQNEALRGYAEGVRNAREAQRQAASCGMPADRPIYFSVDFDASPGQQGSINSYFDGVASVIGRKRCGAYGGFYVIKRLFDAGKIAWGWQTYAWSGGQWDHRAQIRQVKNNIKVDGRDCDADEALTGDFGQWRPTGGLTVCAYQRANVRKRPTTDAEIVSYVVAGECYPAHCWTHGQKINVSNDIWVRLPLPAGGVGYVSAVYLKGDERGDLPASAHC